MKTIAESRNFVKGMNALVEYTAYASQIAIHRFSVSWEPLFTVNRCWLFISLAVIHYARPNGTSVSEYITLSSHRYHFCECRRAPLFSVLSAHDFLLIIIIGEAGLPIIRLITSFCACCLSLGFSKDEMTNVSTYKKKCKPVSTGWVILERREFLVWPPDL